jgi:rubredoxin
VTADCPNCGAHVEVFRVEAPVPMRLTCPECQLLHVDEGEFATKPHHTHSCQGCGLTWRPAVVNTVGVRFLPGFKNKPSDPTGTPTLTGDPDRRLLPDVCPFWCGLELADGRILSCDACAAGWARATAAANAGGQDGVGWIDQ